MALSICLMNVKCSNVIGLSDPYIAIHGTGMLSPGADPSELTLTFNGAPVQFITGFVSPYLIHAYRFNPAFASGTWCAKIRNVEFCTILTCPQLDLSGIHYIDSSRLHMRDSYNSAIKQIPNPTIRTALIGE